MADNRAVAFLELNIKGFQEALNTAKAALAVFGVSLAAFKTAEFWKDGIQGAIEFGNEAYIAAQKLNGYDPGRLLIVQKALQAAGQSAQEARGNIEEFAMAGRPLEQLFKGGQAGFGDALGRAAREYGTQAAVLTKSAEQFAFVQQQIINLGTKLQGFFLGLAQQIAGPLSSLLDQLDKIDLVGMGQKFGSYITEAVNVLIGLIKNQNLFTTISLALKLGFQEAVNYLTGGINSVLTLLLQGNLWSGIAETAIGALGVIGTFLTSVILGIGKLLIATVEAAFARIAQKYSPLFAALNSVVPGIGLVGEYLGNNSSTDVSKNLADIEKNPAIQSEEAGSQKLIQGDLAVAAAGLKKLGNVTVGFTPGKNYDTTELQAQLAKAIKDAAAMGAALTAPNGRVNSTFSEKADPYHVIADSLAKVGGGGRYVRTGLSIADKAALDSIRYQQQMLGVQKQIEKNTAKQQSQRMGGG